MSFAPQMNVINITNGAKKVKFAFLVYFPGQKYLQFPISKLIYIN